MTNMIRLSVIQRGDWPDVIKMQLHGEFRDYVTERTCMNTETPGEGFFTCSACGGSAVIEWTTSGWGKPNYCPQCGAKVVEEA